MEEQDNPKPKRQKKSKKKKPPPPDSEAEKETLDSKTDQVGSNSTTQESRRKTLEFLKLDDPKTKNPSNGIASTVDKALLHKKLVGLKPKGEKASDAEADAEEAPKDKGWKNVAKKKVHDGSKSKAGWLSRASEVMFFGLKDLRKQKAAEVNLKLKAELEDGENKGENLHGQTHKNFDEESYELKKLENEAKKAKREKMIQSMKNAGRPKQNKFDWLFRPSEMNLFRGRRAVKEIDEDEEDEGNFQLKKKLEEQARKEEEERKREAKRLRKLEKKQRREEKKAHRQRKLLEEENQGLDTYEPHSPKVHKRTGRSPEDIFGYQSMLHSRKHHVFKLDETTIDLESDAELNEMDDEKDMTWLFQLSASDENKIQRPEYFEPKEENSTEGSLWLFWLFILSGGRMPFHFVKTADSGKSELTCQMKKNGLNFYAFVISTLLLVFLTVVSSVNLFLIIIEQEVKGEPHNQIEKLLFEKNKVTAAVFLTSLTLASISSIDVLFYGDSIAQYMTLWAKTLNEFKFKSSSGIMTVTIIYIIWSLSLFVIRIPIFWLTLSDPIPNPLTESLHLLTAMVFRSFVPNVLIQIDENPDSQLDIHSSDQLWKYGIFIVCLNAYALYCSMNFVILVVLHSIGIRNMATEWNFRLRLILRQTDIKESEHFLLNVANSLSYKKMFDWHRKILLLVDENKNVFGTILVFFYLASAFVLAGEVYDLSIYTVGQEQVKFNLNESAQPYDFGKGSQHFIYLCFYMSQTIGIFLFISLLLAETSTVVMDGLIPIIRHNYMNIISTHRRNFFMSLSMSFSARKPHLLGGGGIFSIDRSFILGFLAFFMYFFSVMIQSRHPRILTVPIVLECPPPTGRFCVATKHATSKDFDTINLANEAAALKYKEISTSISSVPMTISLPTTPTATIKIPLPIVTPAPPVPIVTPAPPVPIVTPAPPVPIVTPAPPVPIVTPAPPVPIVTPAPPVPIVTPAPPVPIVTPAPPIPTSKAVPSQNPNADSCQNVAKLSLSHLGMSPLLAVKVDVGGITYALCCYDYGNLRVRTCNIQDPAERAKKCIVNPSDSDSHPFQFKYLHSSLQSCLNTNKDGKCTKANGCLCGPRRKKPTGVTAGSINCP